MSIWLKILVFLLFTSGAIFLARMAPAFFSAEKLSPAKILERVGFNNLVTKENQKQEEEIEKDSVTISDSSWSRDLAEMYTKQAGSPLGTFRQRSDYWVMEMPRGRPLHDYAWEFEKFCKANGIKVVSGKEIKRPFHTAIYQVIYLNKPQQYRIYIGDRRIPGSARIAIIITGIDTCTKATLDHIQDTWWKKTLAIDFRKAGQALKSLNYADSSNELLLKINMEPSRYPYVHPGENALFIHHSRNEVKSILSKALNLFPDARGFISLMGDRAVENEPLMDHLFSELSNKSLIFLDATGSQRSLVRKMGLRHNVTDFSYQLKNQPWDPQITLNRKLLAAQKTGGQLWLIEYSPERFGQLVQLLEAEKERLLYEGAYFTILSELLSS